MADMNVIEPEDRNWAAMAHLSGLAGYAVPLGGVVAPIVIYFVKDDMPVVRAIAKQALLLNVVAFLALIPIVLMFLTIVLIPVAILASIIVGLAAVVLPIIGAVKAYDGYYFRYPVVGGLPELR